MDILRRDNGGDGDQADTPGIEAPPIIGQDERRMHVRAYNYWAKLLEGRTFPSIEALDISDMGDFGDHAVLLDFTSGIDNPAITFLGDKLAAECEMPDDVQYIDDVPRRSLLSRLTDHYLQIIANRAPIGFEAEFTNGRDKTILYRGVMLPFSSDDDTIDFILGVINWKQAADTELADQIAGELASAPAPAVERPTVPVWADGPVAGELDEAAGDVEAEAEDEDLLLDASMAADDDYVIAPLLGDVDVITPSLAGDDGADEAAPFDADEASLADWLASARDCADLAEQNNARSRTALYQAIGRAWGFACAAEAAPDDYAELLDEAGITASPRAPMTPVVKLVFGIHHDKTRLAEYAAVLGYAQREAIAPDALPAFIAQHDGGLKGLVRAIRTANRPVKDDAAATKTLMDALRVQDALAHIDSEILDECGEFTVMVVRRAADGAHEIVAISDIAVPAAERFARASLR